MISRQNGVCFHLHTRIQQVALRVSQSHVRSDVYLTANHHVGADECVITVGLSAFQRTSILRISERNVVFGDSVTTFYAEHVFSHKSIALDFLHPIGIFVEEMRIDVGTVLQERIVFRQCRHRWISRHTQISEITTIFGRVHHGDRGILEIDSILSAERDTRVEIIARGLLGFNHDNSV